MPQLNFLVLALAALIPMFIGFIWYNPKVFGSAWMNASGLSEEKMKGANMPIIFLLSYLFAFLAATSMASVTIHQFHIISMLMSESDFMKDGAEATQVAYNLMENYGDNFRTFKHGAFHGTIISLLLVLPVLATNALFERKGFKYIAINWGYWAVTLTLMGGTVCQFN